MYWGETQRGIPCHSPCYRDCQKEETMEKKTTVTTKRLTPEKEESGNIIENSIVLNDCEIKGSYIKDSKITQGKKIDYGNKIVKEVW